MLHMHKHTPAHALNEINARRGTFVNYIRIVKTGSFWGSLGGVGWGTFFVWVWWVLSMSREYDMNFQGSHIE